MAPSESGCSTLLPRHPPRKHAPIPRDPCSIIHPAVSLWAYTVTRRLINGGEAYWLPHSRRVTEQRKVAAYTAAVTSDALNHFLANSFSRALKLNALSGARRLIQEMELRPTCCGSSLILTPLVAQHCPPVQRQEKPSWDSKNGIRVILKKKEKEETSLKSLLYY